MQTISERVDKRAQLVCRDKDLNLSHDTDKHEINNKLKQRHEL